MGSCMIYTVSLSLQIYSPPSKEIARNQEVEAYLTRQLFRANKTRLRISFTLRRIATRMKLSLSLSL